MQFTHIMLIFGATTVCVNAFKSQSATKELVYLSRHKPLVDIADLVSSRLRKYMHLAGFTCAS
jgi:hypothetical protein